MTTCECSGESGVYRFSGNEAPVSVDAINRRAATERPVIKYLCARSFRGVLVDVGAGVGLHAVHYANDCSPSLVLAIDGDPVSEAVLRRNVAANRRTDVPVRFCRSWVSASERMYLNRFGEDDLGGCFLSEVPIADSSEAVRARRLDEICAPLPRIDLIRVDTENHELEVLKSARGLLNRDRPEISAAIPYHSFVVTAELLRSCGYLCVEKLAGSNYHFAFVGRMAARFDQVVERMPWSIRSRLRWNERMAARHRRGRNTEGVRLPSDLPGWFETV